METQAAGTAIATSSSAAAAASAAADRNYLEEEMGSMRQG